MAYCSANGSITNVGSEWKYDRLWGEARSLGDYYIMVDTMAPTIRPVTFQRDMRGRSSMTFSIRDNFSTTGAAQPLKFRGTIDGQWVLFEYDQKTSRLFYQFDERVTSGEHLVRVELTDAMGNQSVFERSFLR